MNPEKVWESTSLIRFPDCDPFNHLNNARYIDYFVNAREDHLRTYAGFHIYRFAQEQGLSWVVSKNQIAYIRPAFLMENVVIASTLLELRERDLLVEMQMWNEGRNKLKSVLWTEFAHINLKTQKAQAHGEELITAFRRYINPLPAPVNFDQRVALLKELS